LNGFQFVIVEVLHGSTRLIVSYLVAVDPDCWLVAIKLTCRVWPFIITSFV
jgi:hypothetical protein